LSDQYQLALGVLQDDLFALGHTRAALEATQQALTALRQGGRAQTLPFEHELADEAYYLDQLGEVRQADSVLHLAAELASAVDRSKPSMAEVILLAGDIQIQLGHPDSALAAYTRALRTVNRLDDRVYRRWAWRGLAQAYITTRHWLEARRILGQLAASDPPGRHGITDVLRGYLTAAAGDPRLGLRLLSEGVASQAFPDLPSPYNLLKGMVLAAEVALAARDTVAADTLANQALRMARHQGHRDEHSAIIGRALMVQAQVRIERGDRRGARDALARALPALEYALGPEHSRTRAAAALLRRLAS
jgi:tetratricopeptide (TPR) repeat protein